MQKDMVMVIGGVIIVLLSLAFVPIVITQAMTAGTSTGVGSFGGTQGVIDVLPLIFTVIVVIVGISVMIGGSVSIIRSRRNQ